MTKDVITVDENTPVNEFKPYFTRRNIHHILVTDKNDELTGIISSHDVARTSNIYVDNKLRAKHFMSGMPLTVDQDAKLDFVLDVFLDNLYRALPVMGKDFTLVGIITPYDLLRHIRSEH